MAILCAFWALSAAQLVLGRLLAQTITFACCGAPADAWPFGRRYCALVRGGTRARVLCIDGLQGRQSPRGCQSVCADRARMPFAVFWRAHAVLGTPAECDLLGIR